MSRVKKLLMFLSNPWFYILLYFVASLIILPYLTVRPVKKLVRMFIKQTTEIKVIKNKMGSSEKTYLNSDPYSSLSYSMDTNDEEKTITTAGIICILPNGNILHVIMTGENVNGGMKNIEETIGFLTKHQNEIFDDMARTIVEAERKSLPIEPKKERPLENESNAPIKKKV
mgnify:FL=1